MSDPSEPQWESLWEQLPVENTPDLDHQRGLRSRVIQTYQDAQTPEAAENTGNHLTQQIGHFLMRYKIPHLSAVAATLAVAIFLLQGTSPALAFDELIEQIAKARTVQYDMIVRVPGLPDQISKVYHKGQRTRTETGEFTTIVDHETHRSIVLHSTLHSATVIQIEQDSGEAPNQPPLARQSNMFEAMRDLYLNRDENAPFDVEPLGTQKFDGTKLTGFRVQITDIPISVWANPQSNAPVRIEMSMKIDAGDAGPQKSEIVMNHYKLDVDLDDSLFSLQVPDGYTTSQSNVKFTQPTEAALIKTLRLCSEGPDQAFPAGLGIGDMTTMITRLTSATLMDSPEIDPTEASANSAVELSGGFTFAMIMTDENEASYAGADAKPGDAARPIFWYKPTGEAPFRVIYADLSIKEAADPPNIDGAIRVGSDLTKK